MEEFIKNWGYLAVFLGACIEGESIILIAAYLATIHYLDIYKVTVTAFAGTLLADQGMFFIGRYYGPKLLRRYPSLQPKADKIFDLLHRYDKLFILSFRFVYGVRNASPLILGASRIKTEVFVILNFIAAVLWSVISCFGLYYLIKYISSHFPNGSMDNFHHVLPILGVGVVILIGIGAIIFNLCQRRGKKNQQNHSSNS